MQHKVCGQAMNALQTATAPDPTFRDAVHFWEPRRIWYNGVLTAIVFLWVAFTWPHFRPAFTLPVLGAMLLLALLANICYSAAYPPDLFMQSLAPSSWWRRLRQILWAIGMLFAILIENYWIADEIYPDVGQSAPDPFSRSTCYVEWNDCQQH